MKRKTYYAIYLVDRPPTTAASVRKVRKILRQEERSAKVQRCTQLGRRKFSIRTVYRKAIVLNDGTIYAPAVNEIHGPSF